MTNEDHVLVMEFAENTSGGMNAEARKYVGPQFETRTDEPSGIWYKSDISYSDQERRRIYSSSGFKSSCFEESH